MEWLRVGSGPHGDPDMWTQCPVVLDEPVTIVGLELEEKSYDWITSVDQSKTGAGAPAN